MKKKIICLGILSVAVCAIVVAQTTNEVTSVNAVGYVRLNVVSNQYVQYGMQFDSITNAAYFRIADIFGTNNIPNGTLVMVYTGSGYNTESYVASIKKWQPNTNILVRGDAFWVKATATTSLVIMGQVPVLDTPIVIDPGYNMITYPYPLGTPFTNTFLATNANNGDIIMKYTGSGYISWSFVTGMHKWMPTNPPLDFVVGEGFWFKGRSTNFVEKIPYTLN